VCSRWLWELRRMTAASLAAKYSTLGTLWPLMLWGGSEDPAAVDGLDDVGVGITLPDGMRGCLGVSARCMRTAALGVMGKSEGTNGVSGREDSEWSSYAVAAAVF
jgi:hypothetical protein